MGKEANKNNVKPEVKKEVVTIQDFKSILVGMDLILGDQWTPDESQWKRIRKKIDSLIETHERSNRNVPELETLRFRDWPGVPASTVPVGEPAPSTLTPVQSALTPPLTSNVPVDGSIADGSGAQVKTPDIDSRAGYKSKFV